MASKVTYPQSTAPVVPPGVPHINYAPLSPTVPEPDADDRIGEALPDEGFVPNAMPRAATPSAAPPTEDEQAFASKVLHVRDKLTAILMEDQVAPHVASAALVAAAANIAELGIPDVELRERLTSALRALNA